MTKRIFLSWTNFVCTICYLNMNYWKYDYDLGELLAEIIQVLFLCKS